MKPSQFVIGNIDRQLSYDPETGLVSHIKTKHSYTGKNSNGYITITVFMDTKYEGCELRANFLGHQLAWYLAYHEWANLFIDHINGNRSDNRLSNLRLATNSQNQCNVKKTTRKTTSQYKGVRASGQRWRAVIYQDTRQINLGTFTTEAEAAQAYNAKAAELFGEYASLNTITP